jgi:choline dehydrogenase-like flavoprotein
MRIFDLRAPQLTPSEPYDVCVVGAGAAGLFLSTMLARRNVRVALLDAGGAACTDGEAIGIETVVEGGPYGATTAGRAFGLGGTTSRWGGQLIPHSKHDIREVAGNGFDFWKELVEVVRRREGHVAAALGLTPRPDWSSVPWAGTAQAVEALRSAGIDTMVADWLPFRKRNLSFLTRGSTMSGALDLYLNAAAARWDIVDHSAQGRIAAVVVRDGERSATISAREFVVTAGAVETTRILLEMQDASGGRLLPPTADLGRGLSDHLSCQVATMRPSDRHLTARLFGPRFSNGRMRTFRFMPSQPASDSPRSYFHFDFEYNNPGFELAKKGLLSLQARRFPDVTPADIARGLTGLAALGWNRYARSRLHIPADSSCALWLDAEQEAHPDNAIELSREVDRNGRRKAVVRWRVESRDLEAMHREATRFIARWPGESTGLPTLSLTNSGVTGLKAHDVYHPVGTCRMGEDPGAVVDRQLRVRGTANLSVVTTAVFPSAGTANPTFSMLCLATDLAERLQRVLE